MNFKIIPNEQTPAVKKIRNIKQYIIDRKETLKAFLQFAATHGNAVGLSANQASLNDKRFNQRLFALRNLQTDRWNLILNPELTPVSKGTILKEEYCLTWAGKKLFVERYHKVSVTYYTLSGEKKKGIFTGFEAQIWQHEIDHLNGVPENVVSLGEIMPSSARIGRNEPCPCGSGKKYKKCCI